jgi:hypothetical protein
MKTTVASGWQAGRQRQAGKQADNQAVIERVSPLPSLT